MVRTCIAAEAFAFVAASAAEPGAHEHVEANGLAVYHGRVGSGGPPAASLHGAYMAIGSIGPLIGPLAEGREVIAFDLQGHAGAADIDRPIDYGAMADPVAAMAARFFDKPDEEATQ